MDRAQELRHEDADVRGRALVALSAEELADQEVFEAFLECACDERWTGEVDPLSGDLEETHDPPAPYPYPPSPEALQAPETVSSLFRRAAERLRIVGGDSAIAAFVGLLSRQHRCGPHLSDVFGIIEWADDEAAVEQIVPLALAIGARASGFCVGRSPRGIAALVSLAVAGSGSLGLIECLARQPEAATALLPALGDSLERLGQPELCKILYQVGATQPSQAVSLLVELAQTQPMAHGFAALLDHSRSEAFADGLRGGLECNDAAASDLFNALRYASDPGPFPVGPFLARVGRGIDVARRLDAYRDPEFVAFLRETAGSASNSLARREALCLLVRSGLHATEPALLERAKADLLESTELPSELLETALLDLVHAEPVIADLIPLLGQLAVTRPGCIGQIVGALTVARGLARPGTDRDSMLDFVGHFVELLESRMAAEPSGTAAPPQRATDVKPLPFFEPERLKRFASELDAPAALVERLHAALPQPFK